MSQANPTPERGAGQSRRSIADSLVRLSVGLEDAEDLITDVAQVLDAL